jgi:hypothetical protein
MSKRCQHSSMTPLHPPQTEASPRDSMATRQDKRSRPKNVPLLLLSLVTFSPIRDRLKGISPFFLFRFFIEFSSEYSDYCCRSFPSAALGEQKVAPAMSPPPRKSQVAGHIDSVWPSHVSPRLKVSRFLFPPNDMDTFHMGCNAVILFLNWPPISWRTSQHQTHLFRSSQSLIISLSSTGRL